MDLGDSKIFFVFLLDAIKRGWDDFFEGFVCNGEFQIDGVSQKCCLTIRYPGGPKGK